MPTVFMGDFMADAKKQAEGMEVADNVRGTAPHLASALLAMQGNAKFLLVHYLGGAQAMQAMLGGQTKMMVETFN